MKVKGFLIEGEEQSELLLSVQPAGRAMFERLTMRPHADGGWIDVGEAAPPSRTEATQAVLQYLHRIWQLSGPLQVLDH